MLEHSIKTYQKVKLLDISIESHIIPPMEQTIIIDEILFALAKNQNIATKDSFHKIKNDVLAKYRISD